MKREDFNEVFKNLTEKAEAHQVGEMYEVSYFPTNPNFPLVCVALIASNICDAPYIHIAMWQGGYLESFALASEDAFGSITTPATANDIWDSLKKLPSNIPAMNGECRYFRAITNHNNGNLSQDQEFYVDLAKWFAEEVDEEADDAAIASIAAKLMEAHDKSGLSFEDFRCSLEIFSNIATLLDLKEDKQ